MDRSLLDMLLAMFLTNAFGVVLYCALFSYSFKRRSRFVLRLLLSLLAIGGIATGLAIGVYYGFIGGFDATLAHVELIRIVANLFSLLMGLGAILFCFDEKPILVLFATVMGNAGHCLGVNLYEMLIGIFHVSSIYLTMYYGYVLLSYVLYYATHISLSVLLYFTCARTFAKTVKAFDKKIGRSIIVTFVIFTYIMAGVQGSNVFNPVYNGATIDAVAPMFNSILSVLYVLIIVILRAILVWAHSAQEMEAERAFHDGYKEKIVLQERNMELINLKCHDMKHQLRTLLEGRNLDPEFIEETQKAISIYDAQVRTGNDVLDTLLTQKSLLCDAQKIQLTVMLDGSALGFMSVQDINSFFGNAIDNAIEYLSTIEEEKRFIRISAHTQGNMFTIRVENYCDASLQFRKDGLPLTTKEDDGYHGFGTKSIKNIAQKYGGDASFSKLDELFIVIAYFMI